MSTSQIAKDLKKANILAIDDDEWFIQLVIKKFKDVDPGFSITPAYSSNEAIELLQTKEFDCILCDHKLPGTIELGGKIFPSDGIHLMQKFYELNIDAPVIFITGQGSEQIASEALQLGASGYFIKRVQPGYFSLMATSIRQTIDRYWLQKELTKSEARYRDLFENSTGLIFLFDEYGKLQESNKGFLDIYRYSLEESKGLSYQTLALPEDFNKWEDMLKSIYQGNTERKMLRSLTKSNQVLHLDIIGRPIYGKNEENKSIIVGIQAIARDITDQVKTQQALIDSEEKHRKIVESSIEGFIIMESNGTILDWNPAATVITGLPPDETLGKPIWEIMRRLYPDNYESSEEIQNAYKTLVSKSHELKPGKPLEQNPLLEIEIKNAEDGESRILESLRFVIEHSRGYRVALVLRDVTEKKIAEAKTQAYAKRFQTLIEQAAVGVWITDIIDERTTYVNDGVAHMLGYSAHEMLGTPVTDYVTPKGVKILREKTAARLKGEPVENTYPLTFYHRSGEKIHALITAAAIKDESGNLIETYGFIRDITKQRMREKELQTTKEFLESIIASMNDGLYAYDLNQRITMVNPRLTEILGYPASKLIGKSIYNIFPLYEHDRVRELTRERLEGIESSDYLYLTYQTAQGSEVKASVTSVPLLVDEEVKGAVVTISDVTEQRRIETYLHQLQTEYDAFINFLPLGFIKIDILGQVISYNEKASSLLEFSTINNLKEVNVLTSPFFEEIGLKGKLQDIIYKKVEASGQEIPIQHIDPNEVKHELIFIPFPIQNTFESKIISWVLLIKEKNE